MSDFEEKAKRLGVPIIPKRPPIRPWIPGNEVTAICGECGLELKHMMMYACRHANCPTGLGPKFL